MKMPFIFALVLILIVSIVVMAIVQDPIKVDIPSVPDATRARVFEIQRDLNYLQIQSLLVQQQIRTKSDELNMEMSKLNRDGWELDSTTLIYSPKPAPGATTSSTASSTTSSPVSSTVAP